MTLFSTSGTHPHTVLRAYICVRVKKKTHKAGRAKYLVDEMFMYTRHKILTYAHSAQCIQFHVQYLTVTDTQLGNIPVWHHYISFAHLQYILLSFSHMLTHTHELALILGTYTHKQYMHTTLENHNSKKHTRKYARKIHTNIDRKQPLS